MKRLAMASVVLAIAGIGPAVVTTPAQAQTGFGCGFTSEFDPTQEGDTQTGEIDGGPLANDVNPAGTIELVCSIHVGAANSTHAGTSSVSVTSGTSTGVAIIPPTVVSYVGPFGAPVYMCEKVILDGGAPLYWDDTSGTYVSSSSAACGLAIYQDLMVSGRCEITDVRVLCRTIDGTLCLLWVRPTCLVPLPGL